MIYTITLELELDEESGIYTVTSSDVPGLVTEGATSDEINHNVQEAIECLLEGWHKYGMEIPEALRSPSPSPVTVAQALVMA
jgi:predicted RNase H-like HicB family nuclease